MNIVSERRDNIAASLAGAHKALQARIAAMSQADASSTYGIALKQRGDDLTVLEPLGLQDFKVIQQAAPMTPYSPRPLFNLQVGLAAGLVLGVILVLVLARFDRRIKHEATLEHVLRAPVIGTVPMGGRQHNGAARAGRAAVGFRNGNAGLLALMKTLRSNLKTLGFVEPAAAAARPGDDTHCVSKFLCLTGGASVKNPKGILQSERLLDVLSDLQRISNYVIVDGPSLLDQAEVTPLGLIALGARGQQHVAEPHIAQPRHLIPEEGRYN